MRRLLAGGLAGLLVLLSPLRAWACARTPGARVALPFSTRVVFAPRAIYSAALGIRPRLSPGQFIGQDIPRATQDFISPSSPAAAAAATRRLLAPDLQRLEASLGPAARTSGAEPTLADKGFLDAAYDGVASGKPDDAPILDAAPAGATTALAPAAENPATARAPPAPAVTAEKASPARGWFSLFPAAAMLVLAADFLLGVGNEFWGTIFPKWGQGHAGPEVYSLAMTASMFTAMVAPLLGGWASDKLGVKKTLAAFLALSGLCAAGLVWLAGAGAVAPALFVALVIGFEAFYPAAMTAAATLPITIFKGKRLDLERFNSFEALLVGIPGIVAPLSIALFLEAFGVVGSMWATPLAYAAAWGSYLFVRTGPGKSSDSAASGAEEAPEEAPKDPALKRLAFWGLPSFKIFNYLLWYSLAVAFGSYLHPGDGSAAEAAAIAVGGKILSFHSIGWFAGSAIATGLLARAWLLLKARFGRAAPEAAPAPAEAQRRANRSLVFWVAAGPVGLLGFLPFLWTSVWPAALGMVLFGISNTVAQVKLSALLQSNIEPAEKGRVLGKANMLNLALVAVSMYGFNKLAASFPGSPLPFLVLLTAFVPLSLFYLWLAKRLKARLLAPSVF